MTFEQLILVNQQPPRCFYLEHAACCYFIHINNQVCSSIHSMMEILKLYIIKLACNEKPFIHFTKKKTQEDTIVPGLDRFQEILWIIARTWKRYLKFSDLTVYPGATRHSLFFLPG